MRFLKDQRSSRLFPRQATGAIRRVDGLAVNFNLKHKGASAMLSARDVMNSKVISISPETTVAETIDILIEHGISGMPVVDADNHILGVVTEFAVLAVTYDPSVAADPVSRHMTKDVITVASSDPITKVADLFIIHRIRRVLVVQDGKLAGLISRRDLLKTATSCHRALTNISPFAAKAAQRQSSPSQGPVPSLTA
jgi:CBS domain-containing protein